MKKLLLAICLLLSLNGVNAQDMAALFTAMPDQYIPQLETAWRKDLIDLYNAGKEAKLKNTMEGFSTLKKLTADYLSIQITDNSTVEIKRLPLVNNTYIICVVNTVYGPVADSRVSFFTTEWKPLESADLFTAVTPQWFIREGVDQKDENFLFATAHLDIQLIKYTLSPDNLTLTATYTTPEYMSKEDREQVLPYLKESPRVYKWEKSHFE